MLKEEWHALWKNKIRMLVVFVIILIPSFYSCLFLASMWDPYGKTKNLPVAVVNMDEKTEYNGKVLEIGKEMSDKLKTNDSLKFEVVDLTTAENGMNSGKYYMQITIPKDFSRNATTLLSDNPKDMILNYTINPGKNFIASKMSETAFNKLKDSVSNTVTKVYIDAIFDKLGDAGDGYKKASDGVIKLRDGSIKLQEGNQKITENLDKLSNGTLVLQDGSNKLEKGVKDYTNGVNLLDTNLENLSNKTKDFNYGILNLSKGYSSFSSGLNEYLLGVDKLNNGTEKLSDLSKLDDVSKAINKLNDAFNGENQNLVNGSLMLKNGIDTLAKSIEKLNPNNIKLAVDSTSKIINGTEQIVNKLSDGVQGLESNITNLKNSLASLAQLMGTWQKIIVQNNTLSSNFNNDKVKVIENIDNTKDTLINLSNELKKSSSNEELLKKVNESISKLDENKNKLNSISDFQSISVPSTIPAFSNVPFDSILGSFNQAKNSLSQLNTGIQMIKRGMDSANLSDFDKLKDGVNTLKIGMANLNTNLSQVSFGIKQLNDSTSKLPEATKGLNQLFGGISKLNSKNIELQNADNKISVGLSQLQNGGSLLLNGVNQLNSGSKLINNNSQSLIDGTQKLSNGILTLSDGTSQLKNGSEKLNNGFNTLNDGENKLNEELLNASNKIKSQNLNKDKSQKLTEPIVDKKTEINSIKNNGHGMTPYILSVALWVGSLAFCLMYPLVNYPKDLKSSFSWWLSKASILYPVAVLMGVISVICLHTIIGFEPNSFSRSIAIAIIGAVAFMSMQYFFNVLLGKIGSFFMLIFMMLQLSVSAGTYPVELSANFVGNLHRLVPFTYTVDGLRNAIGAGTGISHQIEVLIIITIVFSILTYLVFYLRTRKKNKSRKTIYEYLEDYDLV